MKETFLKILRNCASLVFMLGLGLSPGCLYWDDPGHISVDPDRAVDMQGVRVELIRHSTACDTAEPEGVIVQVGPGLEYPADIVRALKAGCAISPSPGVEVQLEDSSIVFDFSNVVEPGRFPDGEFDGYIVDIVRTEDAPFFFAALLDRKNTTLDVVQSDLSFEYDRVAINLEDREFDSSSLLKVNLFLADLSPSNEAESRVEM